MKEITFFGSQNILISQKISQYILLTKERVKLLNEIYETNSGRFCKEILQ